MRILTILLAACLVLAGCDQMDVRLQADLDETEVGRLRAKTPAEERRERLAEALAAWPIETQAALAQYQLGAGDRIEVAVMALERPDHLSRLTCTVTTEGKITLPWLGPVAVAGLTIDETRKRITSLYEGRYIQDPQVAVRVEEYRSRAVVVTGAVAQPGVFYLESGSSTVLEMIARAGGLTNEAGDELVLTRRRTPGPPAGAGAGDSAAPGQSVEKVVIDLKELIDEGHLLLNLPVGEGCVLTVPARVPKLVYVAGHVSHPGVYEIKEGVRIDALRAVAFGGGMTWTARPANCFVVRQIEDGQRVIAVDLSKSGAERPPFYLQPGDTLVVGSSAGARFVAALRRVLNLGLSAGAF